MYEFYLGNANRKSESQKFFGLSSLRFMKSQRTSQPIELYTSVLLPAVFTYCSSGTSICIFTAVS